MTSRRPRRSAFRACARRAVPPTRRRRSSWPSSRAMLVTSAAKARRRPDDQHGERVGAAARFEKAFAQVEQMAARLHFARAAQVGRIDRERRRTGSLPATTDVVGEDRAELERECVERRSNSCAAMSSGVASPASCHASTRTAHARRSCGASSNRRSASVCVGGASWPCPAACVLCPATCACPAACVRCP